MKCDNHHFKRKSALRQIICFAALLLFVPIQALNAQADRPAAPEPATPLLEKSSGTAYGARYMVVTAHPEATRVGAEILKGGGSAADAAIAVQLVLGLVEPQSSGIGGGGFALYYDAQSKQVYSFDGRETAPMQAGQYLFRGEDGEPMAFYDAAIGGRSVGVPGTLRLLETLHSRFGSKPWRDLFSPAITLAEQGFIVTPRLAAMVRDNDLMLKNFSASRLYFFPDTVDPIKEGQRLVNPPYATTLRAIATGGADAFYKGDIAEDIARAVQEDYENRGLLTPEDMAAYKVIERKTVCAKYRGYLVCTMGEPSSGGLSLLIALGILENFNLSALGPGNVDSWHLISEASRLAFADRNYYMADPHYVQSPGEQLIDPGYLKSRAALISLERANPKIMPGVPPAWQKMQPKAKEPVYPKPPGTTHFTIVDTRGNILSMTDSVEDAFGSRMYVDGFMLNNQLTDFSFVPEIDGKPVANRVEGGKRPRSTMTPVIMFAPDGQPALAIGSAGGSAIMGYVLQRIVSIVDWKQDVVTAIHAPNLINRGKEVELEEGAAVFAEPLRAKGHPVEMKELNSGLSAIGFDRGIMTGVADPRREGTAAGE
jgi:gamma-glutamyltranspeptidase/glutathione hydrolase